MHNVSNALAAASCCIALGIPLEQIAKGLLHTPKVRGRLNIHVLDNRCRVIDDSYNANVASIKAGIDLLKNYKGTRILVLGDMAELGEKGRECHEEVGLYASKAGINKLFTCGMLTRFSQLAFLESKHELNLTEIDKTKTHLKERHFSRQNELIKRIINEAVDGTTLLIKGSRSAHMEIVVHELMKFFDDAYPRIEQCGARNNITALNGGDA